MLTLMKCLTLTLQSCVSRSADYKIQEQTLIAMLFFQSRQTDSHHQPLFQYSHLSVLTRWNYTPRCKTFQKMPRGGRRQRISPRSLYSWRPTLNINDLGYHSCPYCRRRCHERAAASLPFPREDNIKAQRLLTWQLQLCFSLRDVCRHSRKPTGKPKMLSTDSASELRALPVPARSYF